MKRIKLRLTLDVEFNPNGENVGKLKNQLHLMISDAICNGTLTGEGPALLAAYGTKIEEIP